MVFAVLHVTNVTFMIGFAKIFDFRTRTHYISDADRQKAGYNISIFAETFMLIEQIKCFQSFHRNAKNVNSDKKMFFYRQINVRKTFRLIYLFF